MVRRSSQTSEDGERNHSIFARTFPVVSTGGTDKGKKTECANRIVREHSKNPAKREEKDRRGEGKKNAGTEIGTREGQAKTHQQAHAQIPPLFA